MKETKIILAYCLIALATIFLVFSNMRGELLLPCTTNDKQTTDFSEGWNYNYSSQSVPMELFTATHKIKKGETYVLEKVMPDTLEEDSAITFSAKYIWFTVSCEGEILYENPESIRQTSYNYNPVIQLPSDAAGKTITIEFSPKSEHSSVFIKNISIGSRYHILLEQIRNGIPRFCICLFIIFIGFLFVIINILFRQQIFLNMRLSYLGIFSIVFSIWSLTEIPVFDMLINNIQHSTAITHIALALIPYPVLRYFILTFHCEDKLLGKAVSAISLGMTVLYTLLHITGIFKIPGSVILSHLNIILCMVYVIHLLLTSQGQNKRIKFTLHYSSVSAILFVVTICMDLYRYYILRTPDSSRYTRLSFLFFIVGLAHSNIKVIWDMMNLGIQSTNVKHLAYYDILTSVRNRSAFNEEMERLDQIKGRNSSIGIVQFDINNLKTVNDTLGHTVGDELIREGAQVIEKAFEEYGVCYRIGGDEFVVIIEGNAKEKYSFGIQQLQSLLEKLNLENNRKYRLSIAYGVAYYDYETNPSLWDVQNVADKAMYDKKKRMKDRIKNGH